MPEHIITQELLKKYLSYDPATGKMVWLKNHNRMRFAGRPAGSLAVHGYVQISLFNKRYFAHRLAWLHVYGSWPEGQLDHINGDRADNRISNLRLSSYKENAQNRVVGGYTRHSRPGLKKPWQAKIVLEGKKFHLGYYASKDEAHAAYLGAKRVCHLYNPVPRGSAVN